MHIIILAAGQSKRFGSAKQIAPVHNTPMLQRAIEMCMQVKNAKTSVVLGAHKLKIEHVVDFAGVNIIYNPHWQQGMSSSIRAAVNHMGKYHNALLFIAADQVAITTKDLEQLIACWRAQTSKIVSAQFNHTISLPIIFPSPFYASLSALSGDKGGKSIVLNHPQQHLTVEMPHAELDVDTPQILAGFNV